VLSVIRLAQPRDAPAIAAVHLESWQSTYSGIISQAYLDGLSIDGYTARWERILAGASNTRSTILVGLSDEGEVTGFVSGGPARETYPGFDAELYAIYLRPSEQRHGPGRRLFQSLVASLISENHTGMYVRVLTQNPACRFYERMGGVHLRNGSLQIGEASYPESWFGWPNLIEIALEP
jgi:GNAT superfamily N-acetyltransferase